jgi:hypothetical protein
LVDEKTLKKNSKITEKLNKDYLTVSIYDTESISLLKAKISELSQK